MSHTGHQNFRVCNPACGCDRVWFPPACVCQRPAVTESVPELSVGCVRASPKIQVYSHYPGEYGKQNTLICYVSGFHPPDISIELLKNGQPIPNTQQTDLAFEKGWQFHLTKSVSFTPEKSDEYSCSVRHMSSTKKIVWESNM